MVNSLFLTFLTLLFAFYSPRIMRRHLGGGTEASCGSSDCRLPIRTGAIENQSRKAGKIDNSPIGSAITSRRPGNGTDQTAEASAGRVAKAYQRSRLLAEL